MNNLANEIDQLLTEFNKIPADLARATGYSPPQISRLRHGGQITIKPESLRKLALAFSPSPEVHARLLFAALKDYCTGPGAEHISISIEANADCQYRERSLPQTRILPPPTQRDLDVITSVIQNNRHVRDLVHTIATSCRRCAHPQALLVKSSKPHRK